ncbi:MAG TPA: 6,7-dimethyl-8-ribityllumazine synthase [Bacteroidales bacterium]|nr:6,7-dimethyl-8-ribityllumazine synthase [Bacteroidales bacterium]HSA44058.1 6,7-dimethyl-8-ribityllumazine synthase [Bacteroidales bacterium]
MSSSLRNLSAFHPEELPSAAGMKAGIVVSEWNEIVTSKLLEGARKLLIDQGMDPSDLFVYSVPGSFELPLAADLLFHTHHPDGVICLGCVIQGETRHFEFICQAVSQGVMRVGLDIGRPVIFGVLTTDTLEQAMDRAGGKHGNKGTEAAVSLIRMIDLKRRLEAGTK